MSLIAQIKNELNQLGIKPQRSLGQNFLINDGVYHKIVAALELKSGENVVEVGPGLGTLTQFLLDAGARVVAVEKDRRLAEYLKNKFVTSKNVMIAEEDILKFDPFHWKLGIGNWKLTGNIPYYLTSHLLRTVFEEWPQPELIVLMLQKEVAQRIVAKSPKMSLLAVSVQHHAEPKIISYVSRGSFYPPPKVDSAIIKFEPRASTYHLESSTFFRVVRAGFAGKRKQLSNNLTRGLGLAKNFIEEKLNSLGVNPKRRAETLSLAEWEKLAKTFYSQD